MGEDGDPQVRTSIRHEADGLQCFFQAMKQGSKGGNDGWRCLDPSLRRDDKGARG